VVEDVEQLDERRGALRLTIVPSGRSRALLPPPCARRSPPNVVAKRSPEASRV